MDEERLIFNAYTYNLNDRNIFVPVSDQHIIQLYAFRENVSVGTSEEFPLKKLEPKVEFLEGVARREFEKLKLGKIPEGEIAIANAFHVTEDIKYPVLPVHGSIAVYARINFIHWPCSDDIKHGFHFIEENLLFQLGMRAGFSDRTALEKWAKNALEDDENVSEWALIQEWYDAQDHL